MTCDPPATMYELQTLLDAIHQRYYAPKLLSNKDFKQTKSDLNGAIRTGMAQNIFDKKKFLKAYADAKTIKETPMKDGKKNLLQALCNILKTATQEELINLFCLTVPPETEEIRAFIDLLKSDNPPEPCLKAIHKLTCYLHEMNNSNHTKAKQSLEKKNLSDKETENWIHFRVLKQRYFDNLQTVKDTFLKPDLMLKLEDRKLVYFHTWLGLNILTSRVARGDLTGVKWRNITDKDTVYLVPADHSVITVAEGHKTKRAYDIGIFQIDQSVIQGLIKWAEAKNSDYLFQPLDGKDGPFRWANFNRSVVKGFGAQFFEGRKLEANLLRKIVATHDFQNWIMQGGTDINGFFEMVSKHDHGVLEHMRTYVQPQMFDNDLVIDH